MDPFSDLDRDNNHHEHGYYRSQRQTSSGENPAHSRNQNQRYSEQYLKILQNSVQNNVPIGHQPPGDLLKGSEGSVDGAPSLHKPVFAALPRQSFGCSASFG